MVVTFVVAACGDNAEPAGVALVSSPKLAIVAHQDDDLLFMEPDLLEAERAGQAIAIVYVTAGDDQRSLAYVEGRYAGLRAGYSALFGSTDWHCGLIEIAGHAAEHCRLEAAQLSLVFLGYPDGGVPGDSPHSLLRLWQGEIANATTVATTTTTYDRGELIATLAQIMTITAPATIMTLEVASTHGQDHSDHMLVGALALLARPSGAPNAALVSYRGYDRAGEPPNVLEPLAANAEPGYAYYTSCADGCAACGTSCPSYSASYSGWLRRRYAVTIARSASGFVADGNGQCLTETLGVGTCSTPWQLDSTLHLGDRCVAVAADGSLSLGACASATPIAFDDEDHIWFATPPAPGPNMVTDHLLCLGEVAGTPRAVICGATSAPTWAVTPAVTTTPRMFSATSLALGDFDGDTHADLCAIEAGMLRCALGDGHGGFATSTTIAAFAVDPASLMIRDQLACGSDADGILCIAGGAMFRFTSSFATGTATSLAIDPTANAICGLTATGFACAARDQAAVVRSPFPSASVWIGDLDGDGVTDWCTALPSGPACGRAADAALSTDGTAWAFSQAGAVEHVATIGAVGDLDGDGRADLCTLDSAVRCSTSQGFAFGPEHVALSTPGTALWLGDLDGDGRAEPCVDTGPAIVCARR